MPRSSASEVQLFWGRDMTIRVYSTLTRRKEDLVPVVAGKISMYVCGPTVYKPSHVGHMVGPVIFDTIKRFLVRSGYDVKFVINITDIDDKLIVESARRGTSVPALAAEVTADYMTCLDCLDVNSVDSFPRATDHIPEILAMISGLIDKGHAYASDGDVYFDVGSDPDYGKLCNRDPDQLEAGARIEISSRKRNPGDFALWKGAKPSEPFWPSPWGNGRPGWHIECSAMSMKLLGESIDIHGGGLDLQFPHHENELAQSESFTGKPFAKLWLHNGLMKTGDRKMSKSEGNEIVVGLLLKKHRAETLRCLLLSSHYRSPIEYSEDRLLEVQRGLDGFHRFFQRFERIVGESFYGLPTGQFELADSQFAAYGTRFVEHMADDFNTGAALGVLHDLLGALNRFVEVSRLDHPAPSAVAVSDFKRNTLVLRDLSNILGLFQRPISVDTVSQDDLAGPLVEFLIELRNDARKNKDFAMADRIRKKLADLNVTIEDRPGSSGWRRG